MQMQSNLKKKELIILIKTKKCQRKIKQTNLYLKINIDKKITLYNNKIMQKLFEKLH